MPLHLSLPPPGPWPWVVFAFLLGAVVLMRSTEQTTESAERQAPNWVAFAGLLVAGIALWQAARR